MKSLSPSLSYELQQLNFDKAKFQSENLHALGVMLSQLIQTLPHFKSPPYLWHMLLQIQVKNYAIIDEVIIQFGPGLNIITGETGAGKSILLGALGLVLGDRADLAALYQKDKKCVIEAEFSVTDLDLSTFYDEHSLDAFDTLILRRELLPSMRSRAFINDTPVKLKILQELSILLINVHRQFATLDIFNQGFQMKIVDTLAGHQLLVDNYRSRYKTYLADLNALQSIEKRLADASRENDFLRFQIDEINEIIPDPVRDKDIQTILKRAENSEEIHNEISQINLILSEGEYNISDQVATIALKVSALTKLSSNLQSVSNRFTSIQIEVDDLVNELNHLSNENSIEPEELSKLIQRYDALQRLYFKHQVADSSELLDLLATMQAKIKSSVDDEERRIQLIENIEQNKTILDNKAKDISQTRLATTPFLKSSVETLLEELAMNNAIFSPQIQLSSSLNMNGIDEIEFLFSANPGSKERPLHQVASGGELSRLSLALKSIIASELSLPTMVFDEIDSGVSGDTALRMGRMLKSFENAHQTIVITHSPQVAAQGDQHYFVAKEINDGDTKTKIFKLSKKERLEKLAIMLSSDPPTKAARKNAQELLEIN